MKWEKGKYWVTDDKSCLNLSFYADSLHKTYWAKARTETSIDKSLKNSSILSLFYEKNQIGFVRIVSDYATFAWLCDLYVDPDYRKNGFGKWLTECALESPAGQVRIMLLVTSDAEELYKKYGFEPTNKLMAKVNLELN
jgi:GNAT superfamily N-acetyltransferase